MLGMEHIILRLGVIGVIEIAFPSGSCQDVVTLDGDLLRIISVAVEDEHAGRTPKYHNRSSGRPYFRVYFLGMYSESCASMRE